MPAVTVAVAWLLVAGVAAACPFCGVVGRPLAERRDAADVVVAAAAAGPAGRDPAGVLRQAFTVAATIRGPAAAAPAEVTARVAAAVDGTAILFGTHPPAPDDAMQWEAVAADESLFAHVAAAPPVTAAAADRLRFFAPRLEHPHPAIAEDAFTEFGLAPFAAVRAAAPAFDPRQLVAWIRDPAGDQRRRGLYGLATGLVAAATADAGIRADCLAALHAAVEAPVSDLRAGFDGILGGVLVAEAADGLAYLRGRGLFAADTRPGDARHALAAARFAWESLADVVPRGDVAEAVAGLVTNPAVAAECVVDLARMGRWDEVDAVAGLWDSLGRDDPLVRRAVAGYLTACPLDAAHRHRDRLAAADGDAWQRACVAAGRPLR